MSIPCSQFARRAAVLLPMLVTLVTADAKPGAAQKTKTASLPSINATYIGSDGNSLKSRVSTSVGVSVTPDNQQQVLSPGATISFRVTNTGTVTTSYTASLNCSPQCSFNPMSQSLASVSPGPANGKTIYVDLGTYFGTVILTASSGTVQDTGSIIPTAATYTVSVTPDGVPDHFVEAGRLDTANFTVSNVGNSSATYSLSFSCDAVAAGCTQPPPSVTVGPGGSAGVSIIYTSGTAGSSGYVRLNASGPSSDGGSVHVVVYSHTASVSPPAGVSVNPGSYTASFGVTNTGNVQTTYNLASTCGGQITGCSASLGQITVNPNVTTQVNVPYTAVNPGDAGTVTLTASYAGNSAVYGSAAMSVSVNNTYGVAVTPDNQSQIVSPSGSVSFRVANLGSIDATFNFSVNCSCGVSPSSSNVPKGGVTSGVDVIVSLNGYTGTVTLTASDQAHGTSDTGSIIVTAPTYTVSVTPDGVPDYMLEAGQSGHADFTVFNVGNSSATYSLSSHCDPAATGCSSAPPSVGPVSPNGGSAPVQIMFTGGAAGSSGYVYLDASGPSSDGGKVHVVVYSHTASVTPPSAASVDPGNYTASFTVKNTGNVQTTYNLSSACGGQIIGCTASLGQITLVANATSAPISVPYTAVNRGDAGTVTLTASYVNDATVKGSAAMTVTVKHLYSVAVTPDNQSQIVSPGDSLTFRVTNTGTDPQTSFSITANCTPTCSVSPGAINNLPPGSSNGQNVIVRLGTYFGRVVVTASDAAHAVSDSGSIIPTAPTYTVGVGPDGPPDHLLEAGQADTAKFTVSNVGNSPATYQLARACDPVAVNCSAAPTSVGPVASMGSTQVPITFTAGAPGSSGYVRLYASGPASDSGTVHIIVNSHTVSVTKGGTATVYAGSGLTVQIGVKNTGNVPNSYNLTASCSGTVSTCTAPASISNLGVNATQQVTVTFTGANAGGAGVVQLVARNTVNTTVADSGTVNVTVKPKYTVTVTTPNGGTAQADAWTTASVPFTVTNIGTAASGRYAFSVTCTGAAVKAGGSCTPDSTSLYVAVGVPRVLNVSFPTAAPQATATITVVAKSIEDSTFTGSGSSQFTVTNYAVSVTPDSLAVTPSAYASDTRTFTVTNNGSTQRIFRIQAACAPPAATACSASRDTVTLAPSGGSVGVNVSYTAGDPGSSGTVRLAATDTLGRSADAGWLAVTVGSTVSNNQVQFKNINPGTTIERSACLAFSIVPDVADECGALRIVHPLPAVRTLGKARVPTLIYSSDQVQALTLAVNVILADTTHTPDSVKVTVARTWPDGHVDTLTRQYNGADWQVNRRRRIAVPNVASGGIGILRYSVSVSLKYGGTYKLAAPVDNSELAYVDRSSSAFGGGWWLAGLEQLFPGQYDASVLWVGGDGSTRKYVTQHAVVTTYAPPRADTVYLAAAFDRPDTLLHGSDGKYRRRAGNGLFVEFDALGMHKRTVNRLNYETDFVYDASSHLSTIQLPPWQGTTPALTYSFSFNKKAQLLDAVTAPPVNGKTRIVSLTRNGTTSRVEKITESVNGSTYTVAFDTLPGLLYGARINRRGVRTSVAYETGLPTVARFNTPTGTGTGTDTITVGHTFRTASSLGISSSVSLDSVYVRYDGPQPATVGDTTLFWLDRFGAPTRIVDALGNQTRIARGDPRFPGLATETRAPNNFTTWASYDSRGNMLASTQVNPHGDLIDATTTYVWHAKWDMPTRIVRPEGDVTNIGYNDTTGNRVSQDDGRGLTSTVTFNYYAVGDATPGARAGLLSSVVLPKATALGNLPGLSSKASKVRYDVLGNVDTSWTAGGAWTATTNDAIGRPITTASAIYADSADTLHVVKTTTTYDGQDRVLTSVSIGSATNDVRRTVTVDNIYNAEGQLEHTVRTQTPDDAITLLGTNYSGLGKLVSRWRYDNLGRKVAELAPAKDTLQSPVESTVYDRAGNVTSIIPRRHDGITNQTYTISMTYDALNRLKTRTVPSAGYCARWEGLPKDNPDRGNQPPYPQYPSPGNTCVVPRQDTLYMPHFQTSGGYTVPSEAATFDYDNMGNMTIADNADARVRRSYFPNGQVRYDSLIIGTVNRDTVHKYIMEYIYDRDGRVQTLKHPSQLSGGGTGYQTGMRYSPVTGTLDTVINPLSSIYSYTYDERGQVSGIAMPAGVLESYAYDQDGDVTRQLTAAGAVVFHDVTMSYNLLGKMTRLANKAAGMDTTDTYYSGLGQLRYQNQITHLKGNPITTRYVSTQLFTNDAMGNRRGDTTQTTTAYQGGGFPGYTFTQRQSAYESGTGRLLVGMNPASPTYYRDTTEYDEAGNIVFTTQLRPQVPDALKADRASFYGADGKLRAVDYRTTPTGDSQKDFEEYRYDALGRRVLVRARRSCDSGSSCSWSYVRRTVWAGSQELYEIQMPDDSVRSTSSGQVLRENDTDSLPRLSLTYQSDPNTFYGRVAYTYGLTTDQPLGITRLGYADSAGTWNLPFTVVPLWTMRGYPDTSYFAETGTRNCVGGRCVAVSYPTAYWMPAFRIGLIPNAFHGSLMVDKADASGQLFRRNRYYDPQTGRFTQEDPIGLAGGINVYGFTNGDPVNFSDPFGLCPIPANDCPPGYFTARGTAIGAGTGVVVAAACTVTTDGICGLLASEIVGGLTGLGASFGAAADASNGTALQSVSMGGVKRFIYTVGWVIGAWATHGKTQDQRLELERKRQTQEQTIKEEKKAKKRGEGRGSGGSDGDPPPEP